MRNKDATTNPGVGVCATHAQLAVEKHLTLKSSEGTRFKMVEVILEDHGIDVPADKRLRVSFLSKYDELTLARLWEVLEAPGFPLSEREAKDFYLHYAKGFKTVLEAMITAMGSLRQPE